MLHFLLHNWKHLETANSASYNWPHPSVEKIPLKYSWMRIMIRISIKVEWFVAGETFHRKQQFDNPLTISSLISKTHIITPILQWSNAFQYVLCRQCDADEHHNLTR